MVPLERIRSGRQYEAKGFLSDGEGEVSGEDVNYERCGLELDCCCRRGLVETEGKESKKTLFYRFVAERSIRLLKGAIAELVIEEVDATRISAGGPRPACRPPPLRFPV